MCRLQPDPTSTYLTNTNRTREWESKESMLPDPKSSLSPIPKLSLAEEDDDLDDLDGEFLFFTYNETKLKRHCRRPRQI